MKGKMDPKKLFIDERLLGYCVYCGDKPTTRDHVPSKVLLDEPYPNDLPVVPACKKCNNDFSKDELYLACFIECVITGSTDPSSIQRVKIRRILERNPTLSARILTSQITNSDGNLLWFPEEQRIRNIVLKLARGHAAYELNEPQLDEPEHLNFMPILYMTKEQFELFNTPLVESGYPEIGSRKFCQLFVTDNQIINSSSWEVIQQGRYKYLVSYSGQIIVRMVLSEYLACEVIWR